MPWSAASAIASYFFTASFAARDGGGRARERHRLPHQHLLAEVLRGDLLQHAEMLHLRLLEHLFQIIDAPARHTRRVELVDPVVARLRGEALLDLGIEPVAVH